MKTLGKQLAQYGKSAMEESPRLQQLILPISLHKVLIPAPL